MADAAPILAAGGLSDPVLAIDQRLLDQGIDAAMREEVIAALRGSIASSIAQVGSPALAELACSALAKFIPCDSAGTSESARPGGVARVEALIGPTGVGKTTTIAKLAAAARLHRGKRVAMVTADTYRVAAVDQLRTYADIMEIPLRVAMTPEEARAAVAHFADYDLVLVDTAGRSPSDATRLSELRAVLGATRPSRTHLVLAATAGPGVLRRVIESFAPLGADACIITKLDESPTIGSAIAAARSAGVRISHVTNGQEVPDDLVSARCDMLARRVLGIDS
jgi:flagellar biosynthesis protein FlhF